MTDIHSEIEINNIAAENLEIEQPPILESLSYFLFVTEDLESEIVRVELNTDMRCIGGELSDDFNWNDPHLKAQIRSHCLYFVNISNFRFKESFDLSYLFVENPIRYEEVNETVYAVTDKYKNIQVAVPIYTPYEVERENCWFNETLNESFCYSYNVTKYNVTGKLIKPDEFSDYSPELFIINIIPDDNFETIEIGIGLGNRAMVTNLTENKYEIGSSLSDSVIYLDPYLYSASVGTPMEPVITTGEHFETNFESAFLEDGLVLAMTFDNSTTTYTTLEDFSDCSDWSADSGLNNTSITCSAGVGMFNTTDTDGRIKKDMAGIDLSDYDELEIRYYCIESDDGWRIRARGDGVSFADWFTVSSSSTAWKTESYDISDDTRNNTDTFYLRETNANDQLVCYFDYIKAKSLSKVFDDSLNGNDGTVTGAVINSTGGKYGLGGVFDGDGDYINFGGYNVRTDSYSYTISAWVNVGTDSGHGLIYGSFPFFCIDINNGQLNGWHNGYSASPVTSDLQNQGWKHVVVVFDTDEDEKYFHIDGVYEGEDPAWNSDINNNYNFYIGEDVGWGSYETNFNGSIDEVMIWNRSLNSTEISEIYNNQKMIFENENFEVQSGRWYVTERSDTQDEWGNDNKGIKQSNIDGSAYSKLDLNWDYYNDKNFTIKFKHKLELNYGYFSFNLDQGVVRPRIIFAQNSILGDGFNGANFPTVTDSKGYYNWRDIKIIRNGNKIFLYSDNVLIGYTNQTSITKMGFAYIQGYGVIDNIQIYEHAPQYDSSLVYAMGDEGRNLVEDYNPLNISENGATWNVTDNAYEFDGVNDYTTFNSIDSSFTNGRTISFWLYPLLNSDRSRIMHSENWFSIYYDIGSTRIYYYGGNGSSWSTQQNANCLTYDVWQFITFVDDGSSMYLYKNGVEQDTGGSIGLGGISDDLFISHSLNHFNGSISDVLIFNRSLSTSEITDIYNRDRSKYFPTTKTNTIESLKLSLRDFVDTNNTPCSTYTVDWQNESGSSIHSEDYSCSDLSLDDAEISLSSGNTSKLQSYQANVLVNPYIYNYYENETTTPTGSSFASGTVNGSLIIDGDLDTWGVTPTTGFSQLNYTIQTDNPGNILSYKWYGGSGTGEDSDIDWYCYNYSSSSWSGIISVQCMDPGYTLCGNQSTNVTIPSGCLSGDVLKVAAWHNIITELKEYDVRVFWNLTNQSDSYSALSESIYIENLAPTVTSPAINNTTPYTNVVISCTGGTFSDSDSDSESGREYKWYENNALISGNTSQALSLTTSGLDKHDNITCSIRVSDGAEWSSWINASNTATIQNTIPTIPSMISPADSSRQTGNSVILNWSASTDADSDSLTYYLKINSSIVYSGNGTNHTLSTSDGSAYSWTVLVSDGETNSSWTSAQTFTENSLPTTTASISPSSPLVGNNLTCNNVTLSDNESDSVTISSYDWHNGTSWLSINSKTLDSGNTSKGQSWKCKITLNDSHETTSIESGAVNVTNAVPEISNVQYALNNMLSGNESYSINFTVSDEDGIGEISSCWIQTNAGNFTATLNGSLCNVTLSIPQSNSVYLTPWVEDVSGDTNSSTTTSGIRVLFTGEYLWDESQESNLSTQYFLKTYNLTNDLPNNQTNVSWTPAGTSQVITLNLTIGTNQNSETSYSGDFVEEEGWLNNGDNYPVTDAIERTQYFTYNNTLSDSLPDINITVPLPYYDSGLLTEKWSIIIWADQNERNILNATSEEASIKLDSVSGGDYDNYRVSYNAEPPTFSEWAATEELIEIYKQYTYKANVTLQYNIAGKTLWNYVNEYPTLLDWDARVYENLEIVGPDSLVITSSWSQYNTSRIKQIFEANQTGTYQITHVYKVLRGDIGGGGGGGGGAVIMPTQQDEVEEIIKTYQNLTGGEIETSITQKEFVVLYTPSESSDYFYIKNNGDEPVHNAMIYPSSNLNDFMKAGVCDLEGENCSKDFSLAPGETKIVIMKVNAIEDFGRILDGTINFRLSNGRIYELPTSLNRGPTYKVTEFVEDLGIPDKYAFFIGNGIILLFIIVIIMAFVRT